MRDLPQAVMLFAAGFGTRMGTLTKDQPKPMVRVAGRPLIDHTLDLLDGPDLPHRVANLHYKPDALIAHLQGRNIAFSHEQPDILETGGGLRHALPLLGNGPVVTMNTDAIWRGPNPVQMLLEAWRPDDMDALLILIPRTQAIGHNGKGDFLLGPTGQLTRGAGLIYGGVQIIRTDALRTIDETAFSLNLLWDKMLKQGRAYGLPYTGNWCDVGSPKGVALAEKMIAGADV